MPQPTEELVRLAVDDLAAAFPTTSSPRILDCDVIRLASAMLAAKPGTHQYRPISTSPFINFLVTGAWTDTGWPANLESAILSGQRGAEAISAQLS